MLSQETVDRTLWHFLEQCLNRAGLPRQSKSSSSPNFDYIIIFLKLRCEHQQLKLARMPNSYKASNLCRGGRNLRIELIKCRGGLEALAACSSPLPGEGVKGGCEYFNLDTVI